MLMNCPFCDAAQDAFVWSNDLVVAFLDRFPVSKGHTLVVPRRHVATYFDASPWEQQALWQGVEAVKRQLDEAHAPDGYNVGFNAGEAAGQTVPHLHVHVIPRYRGDMDDPSGGVRGVIPARQKYGTATLPADASDPFADLASFVAGEEDPFLPVLRRAMDRADVIDVASAFVQPSGLEPLWEHLVDALERGATVRVLTGDYLHITHPHALLRLYTLSTRFPAFSAKLYRVPSGVSFHPKAYIFARDGYGAAFIGSSNLSRTALTNGVEWNLKSSTTDAVTYRAVRDRFDGLFSSARAASLTADLVAAYHQQVPIPPAPEPANELPIPHGVQVDVLKALASTREAGQRRGLVVMATGLGKTYLSAFDFTQLGGKRALFVAHREEILAQAAETWARVLPDHTIGLYAGGSREPDADLVFASVQTLSRAAHLARFASDHFDYVVVDEFHHASAASYRKLLAHFAPRFLLGLTATPDRLDGAALLELCDDNLVARVGLIEGIVGGYLVPFRYYGVRDELDYADIPWRSGRFDAAELTKRAATSDRAAQALREYLRHAPTDARRTLVFCCTTAHADFIAEYFRAHGVAAAAVHSGSTSAPRAESLQQLRDGAIEALVAVDVFNEGVDLPDINTILMLRPTESPVIFLQQLGRGLRKGRALDKPALIVVDFIGNHRSFLVKPQALVALTGLDVPPGAALLRLREGLTDQLPEGCSVDIETEALDLLERVARLSKDDHALYVYAQLRDSYARRPTATEFFAGGANLNTVRARYGSWFDLADAMGDLSEAEQEVLSEHRTWLVDLETTRLARSYKMVALEVLCDADALHTGLDVSELAARSKLRLASDPVLRSELAEHEQAGGDPQDFERRWRELPLQVFHKAKGFSRAWFSLAGERFESRLDVQEPSRPVFDAMSAELIRARLAQYTANNRHADKVLAFAAPIELVVSHAGGNPILRFDRARRADIPIGETLVRVDGADYTFRFAKIAVNVAFERPGGPNLLASLLRRWLGPTAGHPGSRHRVLLVQVRGAWELRPSEESQVPGVVIRLGTLPYYAELAVACGAPAAQYAGHDVVTELAVQATRELDPKRHFVVRAAGDSMDGGAHPIADGDLVLCEWATVSDPNEVVGRPVLLTGGSGDEVLAAIKIPVREGGRWTLRSSRPGLPDLPVDPGVTLRVVARVLEVVTQRADLVLWGTYDRDAIAPMFGQQNNPSWRSGHKDVDVEGQPHSVLMVNLRKPEGTPLEHRYADSFTARDRFEWESQATTTQDGAKGRRILGHEAEGRSIHLFVRYNTKDADGKGEPFVYCGTVRALRHEGNEPVRVWFELHQPLPDALWRVWAGG